MSNNFKIVLLIRFFGYFAFISGVATFFFMLGPLITVELGYRWDQLFNVRRAVANIAPENPTASVSPSNGGFGTLGSSTEIINPVSTEFGIVIEKINANARVVANVDPSSEKSYTDALAKGVAHAAGTNFPGEKGNIYLFSHSVDAPWNVVRYNAVFYLLRQLEVNDRIVMFYNNKRYDYMVFDKVVVAPTEVSYLTNKYDDSILTLQTCDPPGTLLKRLIVRAKLAGN